MRGRENGISLTAANANTQDTWTDHLLLVMLDHVSLKHSQNAATTLIAEVLLLY